MEAQKILEDILKTFKELGIPVAPEKVEGQSTCIKYLGLIVDTLTMQVRIPDETLAEIKNQVEAFYKYKEEKKVEEVVIVDRQAQFCMQGSRAW